MDVGPGADRADRGVNLLGRHPRWRAHAGTGLRETRCPVIVGCAGRFAEAEVAELHGHPGRQGSRITGVCGHEQHVGRLDVAVDHALVVRVGDGPGECQHEMHGHPRRQRPRVLIEPLGQASARAELLGDVREPVGLADLVDRDDVWMRKPGCDLGLTQESPPQAGRDNRLGSRHLERHAAIERGIDGLGDAGKPAAASEPDDFEATDPGRQRRLVVAGRQTAGGSGLPKLEDRVDRVTELRMAQPRCCMRAIRELRDVWLDAVQAVVERGQSGDEAVGHLVVGRAVGVSHAEGSRRSAWSRCTARYHTLRTASALRPTRSPICWNVRPSQ